MKRWFAYGEEVLAVADGTVVATKDGMPENVPMTEKRAVLGNSGNSDAPHLHFHVTDGPSPMGSEGVPYIFATVQHRGSVTTLDTLLGGEPWIPQGGTVERRREIPLENAVVRFP